MVLVEPQIREWRVDRPGRSGDMKVVDCVRGGWGWGREDIFAEVTKFTLVVGCCWNARVALCVMKPTMQNAVVAPHRRGSNGERVSEDGKTWLGALTGQADARVSCTQKFTVRVRSSSEDSITGSRTYRRENQTRDLCEATLMSGW